MLRTSLLVAIVLSSCATQHGSTGRRFMVSSATAEATDAGVTVLRRGGNAVDAAVAIGFALAVTYPQAGNLGGGGFMVIRLASGKTTTIDFRETAPRRATRDMFLDTAGEVVEGASTSGPLAAGVPGSPAGLLYAHERYGRLDRRSILEPAIGLARDGFAVAPELRDEFESKRTLLLEYPATRNVIFRNGAFPGVGERFVQADLAATLERIADKGRSGFYEGKTAELIDECMRRTGGLIDLQDLRDYRPRERAPIVGTYRGATIIVMPPPSSGGVLLIQMLKVLQGFDFASIPWHSAAHAHLLFETMRRAYADRSVYLGDPDFVDVPVAELTSDAYARWIRGTIGTRATPSTLVHPGIPEALPREHQETTHYSVVDAEGNCVSVTTTLNGYFGNKQVVDGAGFFLNDEMDDFSIKPGTPNMYGLIGYDANQIEPGKRMLSSMTPTIVLKENTPWLVVGTPGGSTIITTVLQIIHAEIDYRMTLGDAIEQPRIHHQWLPDVAMYEHGTFSAGALDSLNAMGYATRERVGSSGRVDAVGVELVGGERRLTGWSDSRGSGSAEGE